MDGRVQLPVIRYLQERFSVEYVDAITEPGPNLILSEKIDSNLVKSILDRIKISVEHHHSVGIAVIGHYDCAGNPASKEEQIGHIHDSIRFISSYYIDIEIIGLWVDENWTVSEI